MWGTYITTNRYNYPLPSAEWGVKTLTVIGLYSKRKNNRTPKTRNYYLKNSKKRPKMTHNTFLSIPFPKTKKPASNLQAFSILNVARTGIEPVIPP